VDKSKPAKVVRNGFSLRLISGPGVQRSRLLQLALVDESTYSVFKELPATIRLISLQAWSVIPFAALQNALGSISPPWSVSFDRPEEPSQIFNVDRA